MEPGYFGSFKQSRWLSILVVHEIQLRPRCIMESANESLSSDNASMFLTFGQGCQRVLILESHSYTTGKPLPNHCTHY